MISCVNGVLGLVSRLSLCRLSSVWLVLVCVRFGRSMFC